MQLKHKWLTIIILIGLLLLFAGKAYYDTNSIEIRHYQIGNSSLGEILNGLKVVHLSDLHIKSIGSRENKILEILKKEKPDLIFITGDFIHFEGSYEPFMLFFHQLKPPLGVYAVLGNTEYSNENGSCILCHEEKSRKLKETQNVVFLRNSSVPLNLNGKVLNIIGVDDPVNKKSDLKTSLKMVNPNDPSILLSHSPEIFKEASGLGIDFLLTGHNHGGQIFITKLLRKIIPLDPTLEYLEGFFKQGKGLMYVSRGIGTSYLPFRLGVKPEITIFRFLMDSNNSINSMNPTNSTATLQHRNTATLEYRNTAARPFWSISNTPPTTFFTGFNFTNLIETFNIPNIFDLLGLTISPHSRSTVTPQHRSIAAHKRQDTSINSNNPMNPTNPINSSILFDFESESDLMKLNWECHKWFELSEQNTTSGRHSLRMILPPDQYPGINFEEIMKDWSKGNYLKMDIFNPSGEDITFHIRIDDQKSGWEYADRFDINYELKKGMNYISIPTNSIKTNIHHRPLNLKKIRRMMVFIPNNTQKRELYLDNIRLE